MRPIPAIHEFRCPSRNPTFVEIVALRCVLLPYSGTPSAFRRNTTGGLSRSCRTNDLLIEFPRRRPHRPAGIRLWRCFWVGWSRQDNATHGSASRIGYGSADRAELKCSPDSPCDPGHIAYGMTSKASGDASDVVQQARSFGPWRTITRQFHRLLFARRCRQPAAQAVFNRVYS